MTTNNVTAPERLRLLLPWLNGDTDAPSEEAIRALATEYAHSWEITFPRDPGGELRSYTKAERDDLRRDLLDILEKADSDEENWRILPTIIFMVQRQTQKPGKLPKDPEKRREVTEFGGFRIVAGGNLRDFITYSFMQTLSEPGSVFLSRCPAPAPRNWSETCGRLFVSHGRPGRPAEYCSGSCRQRTTRMKKAKLRRKTWVK